MIPLPSPSPRYRIRTAREKNIRRPLARRAGRLVRHRRRLQRRIRGATVPPSHLPHAWRAGAPPPSPHPPSHLVTINTSNSRMRLRFLNLEKQTAFRSGIPSPCPEKFPPHVALDFEIVRPKLTRRPSLESAARIEGGSERGGADGIDFFPLRCRNLRVVQHRNPSPRCMSVCSRCFREVERNV